MANGRETPAPGPMVVGEQSITREQCGSSESLVVQPEAATLLESASVIQTMEGLMEQPAG
jgi:hypothetical protein